MNKQNRYLRLIQKAKGLIKSARVPRSLSRKNNNVYGNLQHIIMQILRQKEQKGYREFMEWLEITKLLKPLGLRRIPHFTTVNKFALRAKPLWFEQLIAHICRIAELEFADVAIDMTGFSLSNASNYYQTITGKVKPFMQFNSATELKHKLIVALKIRRKRRNENIDFKKLACKSSKQLKISSFLADAEYDSEKNHKTARELGAELIAPLRKNTRGWKRKGFYRKQLEKNFPIEKYKKRVAIEGTFSALKRGYGDVLYARKFKTQKVELLCRVLAYNLGVIVNLSVLEIYFLQGITNSKLYKEKNTCY